MTGRMPSAIGMEGNGHQKKHIPESILKTSVGYLFAQAGYETAYAGKMHLTGSDAENGYENPHAYGFENYLTPEDKEGRERTVEACTGFIKTRRDKPFLLVASLINPHDICYLPLLEWAKAENRPNPYPNELASRLISDLLKLPEGMGRDDFVQKFCPPLPDNYPIPAGELPSFTTNHATSYIGWARRNYSENDWRIYRFLYARLTETVDHQIGKLLDALKESGLEDNTLVAFTSDHGDQDASHRLGLKTFLYEESVNIPLILRWPGVIPFGLVDGEHLVSNGLDLIPTICDFAGISKPGSHPGLSVKSIAQGNRNVKWRESLVVETGNARLLLFDKTWKYMVETKNGSVEGGTTPEMLFNLKNDQGEMNNVAAGPSAGKQLKRGRNLLAKWYNDCSIENEANK
jgi:choline-sulfatase